MPGTPLHGTLDIPGDKSVSHRAIMLAALADGVSRVEGFLEGEDTRATAAIFSRLGVRIDAPSDGVRVVHGVGIDGLRAADGPLDCGNAGTAMRLLAGLLAGQAFDSTLIGDASLSQRPMQRVIAPLTRMGARIDATGEGLSPLMIHANNELQAIEYKNEIASAQVKSAILLAALQANGTSSVLEPRPTRDYTERMLAAFGYPIDFGPGHARLEGGHRLRPCDVQVPADFSSAAFLIVAATVVPGSVLTLRKVGINPRRTGLLRVLERMGAQITLANAGEHGGEPVADLIVRHAPLRGIEVPREYVADMIDEFPALCVAAACASGTTTMTGAAELRIKESDRIAGMSAGLRALGIAVDETQDGAAIHGGQTHGEQPRGGQTGGGHMHGGTVDSHGDHRVAMAFAVVAQVADGDVRILDVANVATSFPGFDGLVRQAGFGLCQA